MRGTDRRTGKSARKRLLLRCLGATTEKFSGKSARLRRMMLFVQMAGGQRDACDCCLPPEGEALKFDRV